MANIKLSSLPTFTPSSSDYVIGTQASGPTDGKMTIPSLRAAMLSKSTDANGWTVYDYGVWKEYRKRVTFSVSSLGAGVNTGLALSSNNLPTGMTTISTNFITGHTVWDGNAYAFSVNFEMTSASATLALTAQNVSSSSRTQNGFCDVIITTS